MKRIEEYIELANKAVENISYPAEPNGLYEPIRYGMAQGGKRLRPALLLAACDAAGNRLGADPHDLGLDALGFERVGDLAQRGVGAAFLVRAAVDQKNLHDLLPS